MELLRSHGIVKESADEQVEEEAEPRSEHEDL